MASDICVYYFQPYRRSSTDLKINQRNPKKFLTQLYSKVLRNASRDPPPSQTLIPFSTQVCELTSSPNSVRVPTVATILTVVTDAALNSNHPRDILMHFGNCKSGFDVVGRGGARPSLVRLVHR